MITRKISVIRLLCAVCCCCLISTCFIKDSVSSDMRLSICWRSSVVESRGYNPNTKGNIFGNNEISAPS